MTFFEELIFIFAELKIPCQMGAFTEKSPDIFIVLTPMDEYGDLYADNRPEIEIQEARIGLYVRNADWEPYKNKLRKALRTHDFTITFSRYVEFEKSTGYHHHNFDVMKYYNIANDEE